MKHAFGMRKMAGTLSRQLKCGVYYVKGTSNSFTVVKDVAAQPVEAGEELRTQVEQFGWTVDSGVGAPRFGGDGFRLTLHVRSPL